MVIYTSFLIRWRHRETIDVGDLRGGSDLEVVPSELVGEVVELDEEQGLVLVLLISVLLKGLVLQAVLELGRVQPRHPHHEAFVHLW